VIADDIHQLPKWDALEHLPDGVLLPVAECIHPVSFVGVTVWKGGAVKEYLPFPKRTVEEIVASSACFAMVLRKNKINRKNTVAARTPIGCHVKMECW
jgi:hypothetical protein